jgi:cadmium resistance protein CadD (predicted permease)
MATIFVAIICLGFGRRNPGLYSAVFIAFSLAYLLLVCVVVVVALNEISLLKGPLRLLPHN